MEKQQLEKYLDKKMIITMNGTEVRKENRTLIGVDFAGILIQDSAKNKEYIPFTSIESIYLGAE